MARSIDHGLFAKYLTTTGHTFSWRIEIFFSLLMFPSTGVSVLTPK
jgi:hypothetical protein